MVRSHRKVWKGKNCVLCGGKRQAETCEHAPPLVLFLGQTRPMGWEFPSCERCNKGTSSNDTLAAFVAYSQDPDAILQPQPLPSELKKLIDGFGNNLPFPYKKGQPTSVFDKYSRDWKAAQHVEFSSAAAAKLALWAAKQSLAMWYRFTNTIASHHVIIDIGLLTNATHPGDELEAAIRILGPSFTMSTKRNIVDKNFSCKFQHDQKKKLAILFAQYHSGFAFVGKISDKPSAKLSRLGFQYKFSTNGHRGIHQL